MSDWRPREHDHFVEPLLGGLAPGERDAAPRVGDGALWLWLSASAISVLARAWLLAA